VGVIPPHDLELEGKGSITKNGAEKLLVHIEQPTDDYASQVVWLTGMDGDKTIWKKQFPMKEPLNTAKSGAEIKGKDILLWSQAPGLMLTTTQRFSWDGTSLLFKAKTENDPSLNAIKRYIDIAAHGTEDQYEKAKKNDDLTIMYPGNYVNGEVIGRIVDAGHKAAMTTYHAGKVKAAADRMELAFECAADCWSENQGAEYKDSDADWDQWLSIFAADGLKLPLSKYIPALNDYGYFLQKQNDLDDAISIYRSLLKRDPNRVPAYLDLANALWDTGKKSEAKKYYATYYTRMSTAGKGKWVQNVVRTRMK
jgi:tetratricopeptide (TPR) repeat protein